MARRPRPPTAAAAFKPGRRIRTRTRPPLYPATHPDRTPIHSLGFRTRIHRLLVPRDHLLVNDSATLQRRLTEIEIPMDPHWILLAEIRQCAVQTLSADRGGGGGGEVIGMGAVLMSRWRWTDIGDDDVAVLEENDGGRSEELAEAMVEKVRVCGGEAATATEEEEESCVICMEEILIGSEAGRMGCKHLYHEDCILNWLRKTPSCPLCRFSLCSE